MISIANSQKKVKEKTFVSLIARKSWQFRLVFQAVKFHYSMKVETKTD